MFGKVQQQARCSLTFSNSNSFSCLGSPAALASIRSFIAQGHILHRKSFPRVKAYSFFIGDLTKDESTNQMETIMEKIIHANKH